MTSRRRFLTQSAAASTGVFYIAKTSWAQKSPGDTINMAVIGFGGRGSAHISGYKGLKNEGVKVAALCDVDSGVLGKHVQAFDKEGQKVLAYADMRRLFENKDIDAVSIATPNHWHSLASIWAMQAGKDVYVEKPVSHCVWEGRQMVNAARKYGRMVQTGTQARSSRKGIGAAVEWVRQGNLGKIQLARGLCYKRRNSIGKAVLNAGLYKGMSVVVTEKKKPDGSQVKNGVIANLFNAAEEMVKKTTMFRLGKPEDVEKLHKYLTESVAQLR